MKKVFLFLILFFSVSIPSAVAESPYVLPYPSTMPGGFTYKIHLILEKVEQYWYFGDFGQFTYNLKESDKYLVEAKTLFEYQQYILGGNALEKSNSYFQKTLPCLQKAQVHEKNSSNYRLLLSQASQKHLEVLNKMIADNPKMVTWTSGKIDTNINLQDSFIRAIAIRQKYL